MKSYIRNLLSLIYVIDLSFLYNMFYASVDKDHVHGTISYTINTLWPLLWFLLILT